MTDVDILEGVAHHASRHDEISAVITVYLFADGDVRIGEHGVMNSHQTVGLLGRAAEVICRALEKESAGAA
ncbi:hypothetical protein [Acetobacter persici]|uniref:Uncharacterized protein n=1 Tax=Acetobacter persici TaxID=1076596 RepID=A0A6V8IB59_9PROT|nr:hypothetical protein [Acetobacter persici]OUI91380.1 hypothetical protein HK19_06130 [Acetobacter persici]GFE94841.1 hypothetical protein DmAi_29000 [Acetobacter persici]